MKTMALLECITTAEDKMRKKITKLILHFDGIENNAVDFLKYVLSKKIIGIFLDKLLSDDQFYLLWQFFS